ncbi:MAG TPA: hypothetical protein VM433_15350 [Mycobacteriales bacterium]|nr:hypothetical protein [Mycobacteriales bacterium]
MAVAVTLLAVLVLAAQALLVVLLPWVLARHEAEVRHERRSRASRRRAGHWLIEA